MLIQKIQFVGIVSFLFWFTIYCSGQKKEFGINWTVFFDPGGSSNVHTSVVVPPYDNVDNQIAVLPVNFGNEGPQAYLFIDSYENVNRYKDLEIRFSKPMNRALTEKYIRLFASTGPLPGPGIGVEFYWASEQRLILNPYRELKPGETYTLQIGQDAWTVSNQPLIPYKQEFKTALDYVLDNFIVQGAMNKPLNGSDDISLDMSSNVIVHSTFQNPAVGENYIDSIYLRKSGNTSSVKICSREIPPATCSMSTINVDLSASVLPPTIGGNTYYYEIKTNFGPIHNRYFSFNYGNLNNPNDLLTNVSIGIMDESQMLPFLGKVIQKFTTGAFKVQDVNGTPRTFQEFLIGLPDHSKKKFYDNGRWNIGEACIRPGQSGSTGTNRLDDFKNQRFISVLGSKPGAEGRGYCWVPSPDYPEYSTSVIEPKGASGEWAFNKWPKAPEPFSRYHAPLEDSLGAATVTMDVYVTDMRLPPFVRDSSGTQHANVATDLRVNPGTLNTAPGLGLDLSSRYVEVDLFIVSRYEDWYTIFISTGTLMYFKTTARLNWDSNADPSLNGGNNRLPNIYLTTPNLRMARTRNILSVDTTGNISLKVRTPFTVSDVFFPNNPSNADIDSLRNNFFVLPWANPTSLPMGIYSKPEDLMDFMYTSPMQYVGSNESGVDNILVPLVSRGSVQELAAGTIPYVKGIITQYMLKDIVQRIAPNVLNSVVGALRDEGVTIQLPSYLPDPLRNFPLTVRMKLGTESIVKHDGVNKGLVSNLDLSFNSNYVDSQGKGLRNQAGKSGMIATRNQAIPSSYSFKQSSANPGFLLSLHSDTIAQAAFHLWQRRGLDIRMNRSFIETINGYSGGNSLFQLTTTLLKASAIVSILAPGREKLQGLNGSNTLAVKSYDDIEMLMEPVFAPSVKFKPMTGDGIPQLRMYFTEMQLTIVGKKPASCSGLSGSESIECGKDTRTNEHEYTLGAVRISFAADAEFKFIAFSNPNNDSSLRNLNALQVILSTENLDYTVEVLEGKENNPFGLDPDGILRVIEPLVVSLVVPLMNSILKEVPLPPQILFPKLRHPTKNTPCAINARSNAIRFFTLSAEKTSDPYLLGGMRFIGEAANDPSSLIVCP
ncbi:Ig-like domain-containing protein [Leptospira alstonii]|uniref:Ig-like domain-containing protein n=1 Tax=Leptospira alstonii TaxID=28452 RepID=UPI000773DD3C|nr:Ig-like domain-containing protein [Leptospira alstonii]